MPDNKTSQESQAECIDKMGERLGSVYSKLWQELAWLSFKWNEYIALFGSGQSRVDLMNVAAPFFFKCIQRVLWEDTILHIARLTDGARTGKKQNLTICLLPELIDDPELKTNVETSISRMSEVTNFCRDWRNRRIAHKDLELALSNDISGLERVDRIAMNNALKSLGTVLDIVSLHFLNSTTSFNIALSTDGAQRLLHVLDDGEKYNDLRKCAMDVGSYDDKYYTPKYL